MSYLVLARKYRPQKFADLIGQETTAKILQAAISQDRIAPAYLFSGPRGTGKTTSARIFAKAINCQKRGSTVPFDKLRAVSEVERLTASGKSAEPCNACSSCEEITKGNSLDVLELDAASHTKVEEMRDVIINTVSYAPTRDPYKIFIIDEVHMLSGHSFNALLKTLEEPPAHVVFILATTEYHKIPATITSRCQRFKFLPLTSKEIFSNLKKISGQEKIPASDEALDLLARASGGAMRDALSLFDQVISHAPANGAPISLEQAEEVLGVVKEDLLLGFLESAAQGNARGVLERTANLVSQGYDLAYFLKELREAFREMLVMKCGYEDSDSLSALSKKLPTNLFSLENLLRAGQLLTKCAEQMRWNDFPRIVFETFAVRLCQKALSAEELKAIVKQGSGEISIKLEPAPAAESVPPVLKTEARLNSVAAATPSPAKESEPAGAPQSSAAAQDVTLLRTEILRRLHHSKPALYHTLETAALAWQGEKLEIAFASLFSLESARRSQDLLEKIASESAAKKITILLKQGIAAPAPVQAGARISAPAEEEIVDESAEKEEEPYPVGAGSEEVYEFVEGQPSPVEDALEDEGAKKFLQFFHGKVTRLPAKPA